MKKFLVTIILACAMSQAFAQDPQLSNQNVTPSPALVNGPITVSMSFQNNSSEEIPLSTNNKMSINFGLKKIKPVLVGGLPTVTGAGSVYFDWIAVCTGTCAADGSSDATDLWSVIGFQNQLVPGYDMFDPTSYVGGPISFVGKVTAASTSVEADNKQGSGFLANLTPRAGFDIDVSAASNSQETYTYTDGILPVKLVNFDAAREGNMVNLKWATTEEVNSDRFEVEHSLNGKQWNQIGTVTSNGESKVMKNYSFADLNAANGENMYRLKMVDKDETFAYSRIRSVKFDGAGVDLSVYPNPSTDKLFIRDNGTVKEVVMRGVNGNAVYRSSTFATGNGMIDVKNLLPGIYIVQVTRQNGTLSTHKVLVGK